MAGLDHAQRNGTKSGKAVGRPKAIVDADKVVRLRATAPVHRARNVHLQSRPLFVPHSDCLSHSGRGSFWFLDQTGFASVNDDIEQLGALDRRHGADLSLLGFERNALFRLPVCDTRT
jgi:hypothetical protein